MEKAGYDRIRRTLENARRYAPGPASQALTDLAALEAEHPADPPPPDENPEPAAEPELPLETDDDDDQ